MKKVLILVSVLVVLAGAYFLLGRREESLQQAGIPADATQVDTATVNRLVMSRHNEPDITFEKDAGGIWAMTAPVKDKANLNLVDQLEKGMAQMKFINLISDRSSQHAAFQIDEVSGVRVQAFAGDQKQADIILGKVTPDRQHVYARESGSDAVYSATGGGALSNMRTRDVDSFRSREIMEREPNSFDSVDVRFGTTTYRVVRVDSASWQVRIGAASARPADAAQVEGLLNALGKMKASGFRPDSVKVDWARPDIAIDAWLLGEPEVKIEMVAAPESRYYVRSSTRDHDLAVFESVYKTFQKDPKELVPPPAQGS